MYKIVSRFGIRKSVAEDFWHSLDAEAAFKGVNWKYLKQIGISGRVGVSVYPFEVHTSVKINIQIVKPMKNYNDKYKKIVKYFNNSATVYNTVSEITAIITLVAMNYIDFPVK